MEDYLQKILRARVYDVAEETPLESAKNISKKLKNNIWFKREDLQPVFSFKLRGAYNRMSRLTSQELEKGVIASSAGNHAQGVALSAAYLKCRAVIVMPITTPPMKVEAVRSLNAEIILANSLGKSFTNEQGEDIIFSKKGEILDPYSSYKKRGVTHLFYAWKFIDGQMLDVTVIDFSKLGFTQMLKAKKGIWNNDKNNWEFFEGDILTLSPDGSNTRTKFLSFLYPLGTELTNIAQLPKDANDMNLGEANTAMELYQSSGNIKEARRMKVRIQEKFTLPIACSVFALIGCSFGVMQKKGGGRSQSFGLSIILILIYYILSFSFSSLGV